MKKSFTIFFLFFCFTTPALAQSSTGSSNISGKLWSSYDSNNKDSTTMALEVSLADEWHTYWRMPGDSGVAPAFDWKKSTNVKGIKFFWPAPKRFTIMGMHSFGYDGRFFIPIDVMRADPSKDMDVDMTIDFAVCHEICILEKIHVMAHVKAGDPVPSVGYETVEKARESLPLSENTEQIGIETAVLGKESVVVTAYAKDGFEASDLVVETSPSILTAPPEMIVDAKDKTRAIIKIKAPEGVDLSKELFGKDAAIVLINKGHSIERHFTF